MKKVITYGTFDLLHYGHINLLKKARELGDYLIVGVTADDFDKTRGKINVKQSLMERVENVRATGLADEIIIEEYEGQKIDDIKRYGVDIFTVGSDWIGKFDYLNDLCKVVYLPRTEGVSSSDIRSTNQKLRLGVIGSVPPLAKVINEANYVNGLEISGVFSTNSSMLKDKVDNSLFVDSYLELLDKSDAIYVYSNPEHHFEDIKIALDHKKHVICEAPISLKEEECKYLLALAKKNNCILFDGIKTAYSTAYNRLLVLLKSGKIGDIVSVDVTTTSLSEDITLEKAKSGMVWTSICSWGTAAILCVLQILGTDYKDVNFHSMTLKDVPNFDTFTKIDFAYKGAVATIKVGNSVKSEGDLVISGTKGYIYVPSPWWKTEYFEVRYENQSENKRYFYQLDGEGIRYELVAFARAIEDGTKQFYISEDMSINICRLIEKFYKGESKTQIVLGD